MLFYLLKIITCFKKLKGALIKGCFWPFTSLVFISTFLYLIDSVATQKLDYEQSLSLTLVRREKRPRHANDHARDWRRETGEAVVVSRVWRLRCSTLARACTPLTKSEEKERLLAVYPKTRDLPSMWVAHSSVVRGTWKVMGLIWHEEKWGTSRRAPGDNVLPDQFQTVAAILASDWAEKHKSFPVPISSQNGCDRWELAWSVPTIHQPYCI